MPKNHILKDKFDFWTQHGKNHDFWVFPKAFMMDLKTQHMLLFGVPRASGYPKIIKTSIFYHLITFLGWNLQFGTISIFAIFCLESTLFSSEKICEISKIHFFFKLRLKRFLENLSHHFKDNDQKNMFLASYPPKQANYTLNFVQGLILLFDAFSAV